MAYALVGSAGAVSQSATGASVTPSYGQAPTAGHLLILWVTANNSALPATPTGWSLAVQTTTAVKETVSIFYKVAAGGDAAPTVAAVASTVLSVQLAEFSGNATTSPLDKTASTQSASTAAPLNLTLTAGAPDAASGELIVTCSGMHLGGGGGAETISDSFSNATITVLGNNDATATTNHYHFAYGVSTSNSAADSDSWSATSGTSNGSAAAFASFKLAPAAAAALNADFLRHRQPAIRGRPPARGRF